MSLQIPVQLELMVSIRHRGVPALDPSRVALLSAIADFGSISGAHRALGISYRHAWELVSAMNEVFGEGLVVPTKGGRRGGGAKLTPLGEAVLAAYARVRASAMSALETEAVFAGQG